AWKMNLADFGKQALMKSPIVELRAHDLSTRDTPIGTDGPLDQDVACKRRIRKKRFLVTVLKSLKMLGESLLDLRLRQRTVATDLHAFGGQEICTTRAWIHRAERNSPL